MNILKKLFWKNFWVLRGRNKDDITATARNISKETFYAICSDIISKLNLGHEDIVLDVGCAGAIFDVEISKQVQKIVAADKMPTMIERAEKNIIGRGNIELICGEAFKIPKPDKFFSKIFCYSVFHFIPSETEIQKILYEFNRLLKDNGLILIGDIPDPNLEKDYGPPTKKDLISKVKNKVYVTFGFWYDKDDLIAMCSKAGFNVKVVSQPEGLPFRETRFDLILTKQKLSRIKNSNR